MDSFDVETAPVKSPVSGSERPRAWLRLPWAKPEQAHYLPVGREEEANAHPGTGDCPEARAGWASRLLFAWVDPLLEQALRRPLAAEDLWATLPRDAAQAQAKAFRWHLASTVVPGSRPQGAIARALWSAYKLDLLRSGAVKLVHDCVLLVNPLILLALLHHVQHRGPPGKGLALALALAAGTLLQTLLVNVYFHSIFRLCAHVKCGLIDMLHQKSMRVAVSGQASQGVGGVSNLQSNDAGKLWQLPQYLHMIWSGPFQILTVMALLVRVIGAPAAFAGLGFTVAVIPLITYVGSVLAQLRKQTMALTDARVKLCTEILTGIKAIKLYAWEEPYRERITDLREQELACIKKASMVGAVNYMSFSTVPIAITIVAFAVYTLLGHNLTADVAFPALALFNLMRFPVTMFPRQITDLINSRVALARLQAFMETPEVEPQRADASGAAAARDAGLAAVDVRAGTFAWAEDAAPVLADISLQVRPGELVVVVGPVGSGKSSLLATLLSELVQLQGSLAVRGRVAYTAQDPWIQNASLRDNVTLGEAADHARYAAVLSACCLESDLALLPAGDATEIGERGVNLSGGQRHRVALARACYAGADVYLLDDPLSAVDAHVGRALFDKCICGMLAGKTRILATHQLQYLPMADRVVVLESGGITHAGGYADLVAQGVNFQQFELKEPEASPCGPDGEGTVGGAEAAASLADGLVPQPGLDDLLTLGEEAAEAGVAAGLAPPVTETAPLDDRPRPPTGAAAPASAGLEPDLGAELAVVVAEQGEASPRASAPASSGAGSPRRQRQGPGQQRRIIDAEQRAEGRVDRGLYVRYLAAWGPCYWLPITMLLLAIVEKGCGAGQNWWLGLWSADAANGYEGHSSRYFLAVYSYLGLLAILIGTASMFSLIIGTLHAARHLQDVLLRQMLRLPMSFYDSQPTGRLLNRFTRDVEAVDLVIIEAVRSFLACTIAVLWCLVLVVAVSPWSALMALPLGVVYAGIQSRYIAASRELKRLDSIAMSPIYSHFLETLSGLVTVRAFRRQAAFEQKNWELLDASNRAWWPIQVLNRWLSVRLELLGTAVVFVAALFSAVLQPRSAGLAGVAITAALQTTGLMSWAVRQTTEMEISMNAVERLTEYLDYDTEAAAIIPGHRPPPDWPAQGHLSVENLAVRYRTGLPPVLHGITFTVPGGTKLGIAGRTGCGKSTLMLALYRIVEPCAGRVILDGIDVAGIGLRDLRSRLALVPQDPVVFSGTVRSNLDPFSAVTDDNELWSVLHKAGLGTWVRALPAGLDAEVAEGGTGLSQGQKQLLALARALLRRSRVLILDEATSNVDTLTDSQVQETLTTAFGSCTVLTIAHRLNTIMGSDSILVLDQGRVAEHGPPAELARTEGSLLSHLIAESRGSMRPLL